MKKFIHALVLGVFGFGCFFTWVILALSTHGLRADLVPLPSSFISFTALCTNLRPVVIALPILAAVYCVWVWFRKADRVPSWIGFFATATGALVVVTLPATVAAYLPLLWALNHLANK
jgi:hypothetical protein